ncbi:hypothetical protein PVNG_06335 [Plasmodium vivax North Korean]|uniref:Variable surface protein n=1 Tax=Plasmodium vivax North Korean TaxID=1035514 RepID=A0A0J9TMJ7_PLAVI|nr:hypothetical protein PVNG_06335 [Plasmodium vivax North Korean]
MIDSKNLHFNKYLRVLFFLKLLAFLHLILSPYTYNDLGNIIKFSENKNNIEGLLDFRIHRSLDEQEFQEQYDYTNINDYLLEDGSKNDEEYGTYYVSPYEQLSKSASNCVGVLQRNYKNRFGKKRGLTKLDHYFEKKVFDKIDDIYELSKKMKHDKKSYKKKILSKYGYNLISFCLLPPLGLIYFILFGSDDLGKGIIKFCTHTEHTGTPSCTEYMYKDYKDILQCVGDINVAYSLIMVIIVVCFIMYILIKVIKYEKIKAIKGKMSMKEYFRFGKDVFKIN